MEQRRRIVGALLLLWSVSALCGNLVSGAGDSSRLAELQALKRATPSSVLTFSIDSFEKFVESAPRSYTIIVMFTAEASMCKPCGPMLQRIEKVAKEYDSLSEKKKSPKPVFFANLKISPSDQQFLAKYAIQHVPIFYAFRAGTSRMFPKSLDENSPDNYPIQQMGIEPNQIKDFVNARTASRLSVVRGGYQIPFVQTVRAFMPLILLIVGLSGLLGVLTGAYKNPMMWFGLVMLVYIFSVGGGHYSWIHNQPLAVVDKNGVLHLIADGSRSQYVAEGFFVSATCVSISVMVILIQELPSVIPYKSGQTVVGMGMIMMTLVAIVSLLWMYHQVSFAEYHFQLCSGASQYVFACTSRLHTLTSMLCSPSLSLIPPTENAIVPEVQRDVVSRRIASTEC